MLGKEELWWPCVNFRFTWVHGRCESLSTIIIRQQTWRPFLSFRVQVRGRVPPPGNSLGSFFLPIRRPDLFSTKKKTGNRWWWIAFYHTAVKHSIISFVSLRHEIQSFAVAVVLHSLSKTQYFQCHWKQYLDWQSTASLSTPSQVSDNILGFVPREREKFLLAVRLHTTLKWWGSWTGKRSAFQILGTCQQLHGSLFLPSILFY